MLADRLADFQICYDIRCYVSMKAIKSGIQGNFVRLERWKLYSEYGYSFSFWFSSIFGE